MYVFEFKNWIRLHLVLRQTSYTKASFLLKKQELLKFFSTSMIIADINSLSYEHVQRILAIFHYNIIW